MGSHNFMGPSMDNSTRPGVLGAIVEGKRRCGSLFTVNSHNLFYRAQMSLTTYPSSIKVPEQR
jgi:hypothetical protein